MSAYWPRQLVRKLRTIDLVKRARLEYDRIMVLYTTGYKRAYIIHKFRRSRYPKEIRAADARCNWPIPVSYEHPWDPLDQASRDNLSKYFHISRAQIDSCSIIERELIVQYAMRHFQLHGYIRPYWTDRDVITELQRLQDMNPWKDGILNLYAYRNKKPKPLQPLIEKYMDISQLYRLRKHRTLLCGFTINRLMFSTLMYIIDHTDWDLNISTYHKALYRRGRGRNWYNPAFYKAAIQSAFKVTSDSIIVDASPNMYEKAITAWMLGCNYSTMWNPPPAYLADVVGVKIVPPTRPYDILILDNRFKYSCAAEIEEYRSYSKSMLAFVRQRQAAKIAAQLPPRKIIKIKASIIGKIDYLFAY